MGKFGYLGSMQVTAVDRCGNRCVYATPNTLTYEAARVASHLLVGDLHATLAIRNIAVGTGTTPPTRSDTALQAEVLQQEIPLADISRPAPGQVEFYAVIDFVTAANGHVLTEAGLKSYDGNSLFARQVHTAIGKDDNFRLEYRWRIVFT